MGVQRGADFYDTNLRNIAKPLEESPWLYVYEAAERCVSALGKQVRLADLGCGTGRFARLLANRGYTDYIGLDFSGERVKLAREYVPEFEFHVADLTLDWPLPERDCFVLLEFLEHVDADLEILSRVPAGKRVVFSVPNFDSKGHVRWFDSEAQVKQRYSPLIRWQESFELVNPRRSHKITYLVSGLRS